MEVYIDGKTKTLYKNSDGSLNMYFKDDMTGENGKFDPGANTKGLVVDGAGKAGLELSTYFFEILEKNGIATHCISSDISSRTMNVKNISVFGKGLEVICRFRAFGSYIKRYGIYIKSGTLLDGVVEFTIKDDDAGDPLITKDSLVALGILSAEDYATIKTLMKKASTIIKDVLSSKELELYDIKLEFGKDEDGNIILIDEISAGNMRVYSRDTHIMPVELRDLVLI